MTAHGWPDGARAACAFTFDLDAETLWMARGVTEPVALSQGRFGPVEALPKILDLLRAAEIHSTFFVPAWVIEHHPDAVKAIVGGGHEVGCHGDVHERVTDLDAHQEERILRRSMEVVERATGRAPLGYRAPAWQLSSRTLGLRLRYGFAYSSNMRDRRSPYLHEAADGGSIVATPVVSRTSPSTRSSSAAPPAWRASRSSSSTRGGHRASGSRASTRSPRTGARAPDALAARQPPRPHDLLGRSQEPRAAHRGVRSPRLRLPGDHRPRGPNRRKLLACAPEAPVEPAPVPRRRAELAELRPARRQGAGRA